MFGPNTYFQDSVNINFSHRDPQFFNILKDVRTKFSELFNLEEYDILFIPGSGTIGIESLMYSYNNNLKVVGHEGVFTTRWLDMQKGYYKQDRPYDELYCLLETSASRYFYKEGCFVDAISAFPYYDIPKNTKGFITCLNKQLGSYIGVAVVGIRKDCWNEFKQDDVMSYLNLSRYKHYHSFNQTPSTFPTNIFEHFYKVLNNFNLQEFRDRINYVSQLLCTAFGDNVIGDRESPVITIPKEIIPSNIAEKYQIYGHYCKDKKNYQFFTYSDRPEEYERFIKEYRNGR